MIDPGIWGDENFTQLSLKARLFFIGLFSNADDEGFTYGSPARLRSMIFPDENWTDDDIFSLRKEVENLKMIEIFGGKIGDKNYEYIYFPKWWVYQPKPDYPIPSKIVKMLIDMGKLDRKNILTIHQNFCRKNAKRSAMRSRKSSDGVGVGVGVRVGVRIGEGVGDKNPLVDLFNTICFSFPKISQLTPSRIKKINLRLKQQSDLEWWRKVFEKLESTPFLKGENKNGWKASFDWLIENDKNVLKVYEGNYDKEKFAGGKAWLAEQEVRYGKSEGL
jgi:hypothetical protein